MNLNEYKRRQSCAYYHIDGLNNAECWECWENICNPGSIEWAAGVEFHRRCVEVSCNQNSKYKQLRLTCDVDGNNIVTLAIWDKVSL